MERHTLGFAVALAALAPSSGCHDTSISESPDIVFPLLDPAATPPRIPLPNDITGQPARSSTVATSFFSGPIDPATITPLSVILIDVAAMGPLLGASATFDASINLLTIMPPQGGWPVGRRIAVALRGSPGGLKAPGGVPVVAPPAFYFARAANPISNCTAPAPNCTSATTALPVDRAIPLEQLRQALAPLVGALVAFGVPREELVLVWTFTVGGP